MKIQAVASDSIADEVGLQPGDRLIKINGAQVRDMLDYHFWSQEADLELDVMQAGGSRILIDIEKDPDDDLGLELLEPQYQACANKCIFCFIHQNPSGMRKAVYFQDEDVRLSFLYGNYVTLAFASDAYLERIMVQRLSPIYVSVHATDPELRRTMLGSPKAKDVMPILRKLADAEILIETQIVLCPDVNDGPALRQTVDDLAALYPHLESISIVPVGLTRHRDGLHPLRAVTVDYARDMIETVTVWQEALRAELGRPLVYLSDEWYLLSDTPFPPDEVYVDCPVIENGVGMVNAFIGEMGRQMKVLPTRLESPRKITFVTATMAEGTVRDHLVEPLNQIENLAVELVVVPNDFFGPGVTVSGLLVGRDIVRSLEGHDPVDAVYLPPNVLNDDGLFLDDMTLEKVSEAVGSEVFLFPEHVEKVISS